MIFYYLVKTISYDENMYKYKITSYLAGDVLGDGDVTLTE